MFCEQKQKSRRPCKSKRVSVFVVRLSYDLAIIYRGGDILSTPDAITIARGFRD